MLFFSFNRPFTSVTSLERLISKAWEKEREHGGKEGRVWGVRNDSKKGGGEKGMKEGREEGMKRERRKE